MFHYFWWNLSMKWLSQHFQSSLWHMHLPWVHSLIVIMLQNVMWICVWACRSCIDDYCWMDFVSQPECLPPWLMLLLYLYFGCSHCLHFGWLALLTNDGCCNTSGLMLDAVNTPSMMWMCMRLCQTKCLTFFICTAELDEQLDQGNAQNTISCLFLSFACLQRFQCIGLVRLVCRLWCVVVEPDCLLTCAYRSSVC